MSRMLNSLTLISAFQQDGYSNALLDGYIGGVSNKGYPVGDGYATTNSQDGYLQSTVVCLDNLVGFSLQTIVANCTNLVGTVNIQFSNVQLSNMNSLTPKSWPGYAFNPPTYLQQQNMGWTSLSSLPPVAINQASGGSALIEEVTPIMSRFMKVTWQYTSGSGQILVVFNGKNYGN